MADKKPSIVFFGTGDVARSSLQALHQHFTIEAVITRPNPNTKRSKTPPVEEYADQHSIEILQPADKNKLEEAVVAANFKSLIGVVIDYGLIITGPAIKAFELGIINSHFSLLPEWRGADPITFSLLSGQKKTGVSVMRINQGLDTGDILATADYTIAPHETIRSLTEALVEKSNTLLVEVLPRYVRGEITPQPQDPDTVPTYSRKLTKADGTIDWSLSAEQNERHIRAFLGWPKSTAIIHNTQVIILQATVLDVSGTPGDVYTTDDGQLAVYCGKGSLQIDTLMPAGKRAMSGQDFLRGYAPSS